MRTLPLPRWEVPACCPPAGSQAVRTAAGAGVWKARVHAQRCQGRIGACGGAPRPQQQQEQRGRCAEPHQVRQRAAALQEAFAVAALAQRSEADERVDPAAAAAAALTQVLAATVRQPLLQQSSPAAAAAAAVAMAAATGAAAAATAAMAAATGAAAAAAAAATADAGAGAAAAAQKSR